MTRIICQPSEKGGNSRQALVKILFCSISEAVTKNFLCRTISKITMEEYLKFKLEKLEKSQLKKGSLPTLLMVDHSS